MADLWSNISDNLTSLGTAYIEGKYGTDTSNSTERQSQGTTVVTSSSWMQPAVIVGIVGVGVAVLAIVLRK